MRDLFRLAIPLGLGILAVRILQSAADPDFAREIQPIFAESCYSCHGPKVQMAGLRLDVRPGRGIIVPGDAANSLLVKRLSAADGQTRMPMGGQPLPPEKIELIRQMDRFRRALARRICRHDRRSREALGVHPSGASRGAAHEPARLGPQPDRRLHPRAPRPSESEAFARSRPRHPAAPPEPRPDRSAAHARGTRRLPRRPQPERLREAGGPPAGLAALRRALGPHLAGRRALRRFQRLREGRAALRLVLSRLGDQRPQSRPALQPVRHRADRRRPAAQRHAGPDASPPASCAIP